MMKRNHQNENGTDNEKTQPDGRQRVLKTERVASGNGFDGARMLVVDAEAEQRIRASELSYRRLFEASEDGILILDIDTGRINDVNAFLLNLLGFSRGEMLGKTVGELSPFKDIVSNQAMLERLQQHGYVRYEDLPLQAKDGRHIAVEFVSNVYQAGEKKVIQCNIRDITKRKQAEEALRDRREKFRSLFESSDEAITTLEPPFWKFTSGNPATLKMF